MAKTAVAIRHVRFEDLGTLAPLLTSRGFGVEYLDIATEGTLAKALESELLVVLGGPIGVYEEAAYPFLSEELGLLERRLAAERPTLGICLGAQLMARALGARVYPGGQKEIGWSRVQLTEDGRASCLEHLVETSVLHWHGDTFELPPRTLRLASTDIYENQAFSVGSHGLALQFHLEASARSLEGWYVGHACELGAAKLSVAALRSDGERHAAALEVAAQACFSDWLTGAGL
jgi:GMP synthase (glutamine-hydrolysing)